MVLNAKERGYDEEAAFLDVIYIIFVHPVLAYFLKSTKMIFRSIRKLSNRNQQGLFMK